MNQETSEYGLLGEEKTRRLRRVGRLLIAGSFLIPALLLLTPLWGVGQATYAATQALFTLALVGVVGLLITIRRGPRTEAWGTFAIGVGTFLITMGLAANTLWERFDERRLTQQAAALDQEFSPQFADLAARMERANLRWPHPVQMYLSTEKRAQAKAQVAQFQALLAERRAVLGSYWLKADALVNSTPSRYRLEMQAGMQGPLAAQMKDTLRALDQAQSDYATRLLVLLDWWDHNAAEVENLGGRVWFNHLAAEEEYLALFKSMTVAEAKVVEAYAAYVTVQKQTAYLHQKARVTSVEAPN